jgi:colanic acid/amylovoran biosynthesis glycosyltransferase
MKPRIAYLVNCYPAPSHSFIRREIAGIENAGCIVSPYSIRAAPALLPDSRDETERGRTVTVLSRGAVALLFALMVESIRQPLGFARAIGCAWTMGRAAGWGAWRQIAYLAEAAWLNRDWRAEGITHVHAHFGTNPAAVARLAHRWGGPSYSFTVHGPDEFDAPGALDLHGKIADAKFVAGISSYGRSQLMRWAAPDDWGKIEIVRCGVDASFLDGDASPPPNNATFACVARLGPQKGLHILIDAVAKLAPDRPDLRVVLVGDGPLRGALEAQVARLGISANVLFSGTQGGDAVREQLLAARVFVLPSFAEGLPVVLMEALALRRPVITTWVAGIPELVDEKVGWLVPPGNADALADAMRAALNMPVKTLAAMGDEGRKRVTQMHDAATNGAAMLKLINESAG